MKTTLHVHRPAPPPAPSPPPSTFRLGVLVSLFSSVGAVVVSVLTDVPTAAILAVVVVVGFALSWRATGQHDDAAPS
jgi:ABC-type Mn2+/Zn2+ transport system permease subunit